MRWLKQPLPKGLYGRAALILILPVLVLQLVVSVLFIQRHYEGVAEQMTRNIVVGIRALREAVEEAATPEAAQAEIAALRGPLSVRVALPPGPGDPAPPAQDLREPLDLTGRAVIATLRAELSGVIAVDLVSARREVLLWLETDQGAMLLAMERRRVSASNPHQLLVIVLFTGLLMTLIAFLFLRNQVRPIAQLAEAAEAFGKGRVLPYRPRGAREVRAAGRAFLEMRARIERQIEQRTLMLSAVSHDLRTPLTRLKLGLEMLPEDPETRALQGDVADMERLVESFLTYARGAAVDPAESGDPVALVEECIAKARRAGASVTLTVGGAESIRMALRPHLLVRALDNLIGNALRYGRRAEVTLRADPDALRLTVEDDGPGIPEDRRHEALQPFARLDGARGQNRGREGSGVGPGVGLGLAIVADAVRGHGGTLALGQSPALGGLRVEIVLPR